MSYLNHLQTTFLLCLGIVLSSVAAPVTFAQQDPDAIKLDLDEILGVGGEEEEELSRLVDKSTISNLEFLNSGDTPTSIEQLKEMQQHVSSLYKRVEPAVVNIRSGMGQGSGVVVTSDGYILTAAHVIAVPNRSAIITFPDGRKARAQTLGMFRTLDAGLLKIYSMIPEEEGKDSEEEDSEEEDDSDDEEDSNDESDDDSDDEDSDDDEKSDDEESDDEDSDDEDSDDEDSDDEDSDDEDSDDEDSDDEDSDDEDSDDEESEDEDSKEEPNKNRFEVQDDLPSFDYLDIGDSAELNLGQWVIAVGHPGGLDEARGIVLRVGRVNQIAAEIAAANFQTDCTLVGGDSGGPLIGMDGSVLGIHSRIGQGLKQNFHVPSNDFVNNWSALLEPVVHDREPVILVVFHERTNVIKRVPTRSKLKAGDRIIRIGDTDIYDKLQFDDAFSKLKPFQQVEFEVKRKGKKEVINIVISEKQRRERR